MAPLPGAPPMGVPPIVPGLTGTSGANPDNPDPMQMLAMMMGKSPDDTESSSEKMSKVVQLLREVSKEDPRIALIASEALRVLIDGGKSMLGSGGQQRPMPPAPQGGAVPVGGPGSSPI